MTRYLLHFFAATLAIAGLAIGITWFTDPYGIYRDDAKLSNPEKPLWIANERVFKTVRLTKTASDVVFLGTSRTDIGIGPEHQVLAGKRLLNLAVFAQNIEESRRLMTGSVENSHPGIVVVGLDFFAFNALNPPPSDYVDENFREWRAATLLLSISSLAGAKQVLKAKPNAFPGECCDKHGFRYPTNLETLKGGYKAAFNRSERGFLLDDKWLTYPQCTYAFDNGHGQNMLDHYRAMLKLAHRHKIDLRLFISPVHARLLETLTAAGLWQQWETWKRELVSINEQEAAIAGKTVFPFWDFSGYDPISTETVPPPEDQQTLMKWFQDSSHYTRAAGQKIVQRLFVTPAQDDWGKILSSENITEHLQSIRQARHRYELSHPDDLADIMQTAGEVAKIKQCPKPFLQLPLQEH